MHIIQYQYMCSQSYYQRIIQNSLYQLCKTEQYIIQLTHMTQLLPFQIALMTNTLPASLELFQKKSIVRLNLTSYDGKNCIRSCKDRFKDIRIPIVASLIHVFSQNNQENILKIHKIKELIYGSTLKNITEKTGLTKQQLFLSFATNMNQIHSEKHSQAKIIIKINTAPFFDDIIMTSFEQNFSCSKQNQDSNDKKLICQNIAKWIKHQLNQVILFAKRKRLSHQDDRQTIIYLLKDENGDILMQTNYCKFLIRNSEQFVTPIKIQKKISNERVWKSISNDQSQNSQLKYNKSNTCVFAQSKTFDTDNFEKNQLPTKYQASLSIVSMKKKKNNVKNSFWARLCCGGE